MLEARRCPECGLERAEWGRECESCGAPPVEERNANDKRQRPDAPVRESDLEPYVALRYIARLFKVLAVLLLVMLTGEIITGLMVEGRAAIITLIGEATRLLVLAGLLWGAGDLTILIIDAGHDLRVTRILLGRINARLHQRRGGSEGKRSE